MCASCRRCPASRASCNGCGRDAPTHPQSGMLRAWASPLQRTRREEAARCAASGARASFGWLPRGKVKGLFTQEVFTQFRFVLRMSE